MTESSTSRVTINRRRLVLGGVAVAALVALPATVAAAATTPATNPLASGSFPWPDWLPSEGVAAMNRLYRRIGPDRLARAIMGAAIEDTPDPAEAVDVLWAICRDPDFPAAFRYALRGALIDLYKVAGMMPVIVPLFDAEEPAERIGRTCVSDWSPFARAYRASVDAPGIRIWARNHVVVDPTIPLEYHDIAAYRLDGRVHFAPREAVPARATLIGPVILAIHNLYPEGEQE